MYKVFVTSKYGSTFKRVSHLKNVNKNKEKNKDKTRCPICTRPILNKNMNKHVLSHQNNNKNEIRKVGRSVSLNNSFEKIENIVISNSNPEGPPESKLQISKQFGKGENIVTIVIRFTNPNISSLTDYRESLIEPLKSNKVLFHKIIVVDIISVLTHFSKTLTHPYCARPARPDPSTREGPNPCYHQSEMGSDTLL
jgi:hypothetical protein